MAIGANYTSYNFLIQQTQTNPTNPTVTITQDPRSAQVWATFAQLNIPIFSDAECASAAPAAWSSKPRGVTTSTAMSAAPATRSSAFNWAPIDDLTIRGGWGKSFRAPNFGEYSPVSNVAWQGWNFGQLYLRTPSPSTSLARRSAAGRLGRRQVFPSRASAANAALGGISLNGGGKVAVDTWMRDYFNLEQQVLDPEKAVNWSVGFDYTPTAISSPA